MTQTRGAEEAQTFQSAQVSQYLQAQTTSKEPQSLSRKLGGGLGDDEFGFLFNDDFADARGTIIGRTTISNPSWTGILTGVFSETSGVVNNVYTPWKYDNWPADLDRFEDSVSTSWIDWIGKFDL